MSKTHYICILAALIPAHAIAQGPTVYASGLKFPSKVIAIAGGNLLVTEVDTTPNSGRVSIIAPGGQVRHLIDGLPSGLAAPSATDPDGPNGLVLSGRTLYIANGEGDAFRNGTSPGTLIANPAGPSSPLLATILKVTFTNDVSLLGAGFTLKLADHFTLLDGNQVTLDNGANDKATLELLTAFRPGIPDTKLVYRNSHPYGLTVLPSQPDSLYVNDAGMNTVVQVSLSTGKSKLVTRFPDTPNPTTVPPPVMEAVPTGMTAYGNQLLVSLLSGAPFVPGTSRIMAVDPATGNSNLFIGGLSSTIGVLFRLKADGTGQWLVLQYSIALSATPPAPGRLLVYDTPVARVLADALPTPSSMALDDSGNLFITSRGNGTVLTLNVGK